MLITIDEQDPQPLYRQIMAGVKAQIQRGELRPGQELPSVRELADSLGINLHTVRRAYEKLRDQGIITLRLGQRAKVAPLRARPAGRGEVEQALLPRARELVTEAFHLGLGVEDVRALLEEALEEEGS